MLLIVLSLAAADSHGMLSTESSFLCSSSDKCWLLCYDIEILCNICSDCKTCHTIKTVPLSQRAMDSHKYVGGSRIPGTTFGSPQTPSRGYPFHFVHLVICVVDVQIDDKKQSSKGALTHYSNYFANEKEKKKVAQQNQAQQLTETEAAGLAKKVKEVKGGDVGLATPQGGNKKLPIQVPSSQTGMQQLEPSHDETSQRRLPARSHTWPPTTMDQGTMCSAAETDRALRHDLEAPDLTVMDTSINEDSFHVKSVEEQ